jgi:methyl-accepting chemotaxis protein
MNLSNLKVGQRIALGFGALVLVLTIVAGASAIALRSLHVEVADLAGDRVPKMEKVADWEVSLLQSARHSRNALILDEKESIQAELASMVEERNARGEILKWIEERANTDSEKSAVQALQNARNKYNESESRFSKLIETGDFASAKKLLLAETRPLQLEYLKGIAAFAEAQRSIVAQRAEVAEKGFEANMTLILSLSIAAVVLATTVGYFLARSITGQLGGEPDYATNVVKEIAAGNLTIEVNADGARAGSLLLAMRDMRDGLANIVGQVRASSDSIACGSKQIAAGNQELSGRTEQQASSLEETASSMEQLTATVKQSADSANQANQLANAASSAASNGGEVVGQVVTTMEQIAASSRRIAEIINVIDGIAFQTNILALNAAVEAARAGEQGRGFAVVAGEVRNLAQRSAQAAREIKTMISESVEKVDAGSRLVNAAGASMGEIVGQVRRVTDLIGEISSASLEQSSGIGQVHEAITQMDQVTQQNAALVEESAAAASSLKEQADRLTEAVAVFKLSSTQMRQPIAQTGAGAMVVKPAPQVAFRAVPKAPPKSASNFITPNVSKESESWEEF